MTSNGTVQDAVPVAGPGHLVFGVAMFALGVIGLVTRDLVQLWQPVPKWMPGHTALVYLWILVSIGCGIGLLWRPSAALASRVLFIVLAAWILAFRLPNLFYEKPVVLVAWSFGKTGVMAAAAWVLYISLAGDRDRSRVGFIADARGLRAARALFGLSLVPFGLAHFMYLDATTVLIPNWLPWHTALAYLTGAAFIAAGLAVAFGILGRMATALVTLQLATFALVVWIPRVLAGTVNEFQRGEFIVTCALTAAALVIVDSYRSPGQVAAREAVLAAPV